MGKIKCKAIKPDGSQCNVWAMRGKEYCYFCNPEIPDEVKFKARGLGGARSGKNPVDVDLKILKLKKPEDIIGLLEETINLIRTGRMDTQTGNSIAYCSNHLIKTFEITDLEIRMKELEENLKNKG